MKKLLHDLRVAARLADGVDEREYTDPRLALVDAGALVELVSPRPEVLSFSNDRAAEPILATRQMENVRASDYDALLIPGGLIHADRLRTDPQVLAFVRDMQAQGKPIAVIGHAAWVLASAGILRGRRLACHPGSRKRLIGLSPGLA